MNGSASRPSSATMNGTRCAIRPGHERHIARKPVELGDQDGAFGGLGGSQRGGELRPPVEGVGALAGLGLDELGDDADALGLGEPGDGGALRLDAQP